MGRRVLLAVVSAASAALLVSCTPEQGPAGTVVDRDRTYWSATKLWTYKLTVRKADGSTAKFKVLRGAYKACGEGEAYPGCAQ